jgi:putative ABC transport system permease protein
LKETSRGGESGRTLRLRNVLVFGQVSLAVVLTVAAVLLARSFVRMGSVDPGFRAENLLIADVALSQSKYTSWQQVNALHRKMLETVRNVPGVSSAHLAYDHPFELNWTTGFSIVERPSEKRDTVQLRIVTPGYFADLGRTLTAGREFGEHEDPGRPGVAVVNESFVRRYFADGNAVGKTILSDGASYVWRGQVPTRFEIVGVVNDVHPPGLDGRREPFLYVSAFQFPLRGMTILVRTQIEPAAVAATLRRIAAKLDPELPIAGVRSIQSIAAQAVAQPRLNVVLMSIFSALGLLLALVGVYGLVALWVGARVREFGVRIALGAGRAAVTGMVLRRAALLIVPGIAAGIAGALALSRILQTQLYGVSAADPLTYAAVPLAIAGAGLLACLAPARRATRVDPVEVLRSE